MSYFLYVLLPVYLLICGGLFGVFKKAEKVSIGFTPGHFPGNYITLIKEFLTPMRTAISNWLYTMPLTAINSNKSKHEGMATRDAVVVNN